MLFDCNDLHFAVCKAVDKALARYFDFVCPNRDIWSFATFVCYFGTDFWRQMRRELILKWKRNEWRQQMRQRIVDAIKEGRVYYPKSTTFIGGVR